ncbi:response regulator transcription factor [Fluoribacter gormanii]|uniref:Transcriptional regulatory protein fixJ n=1 Tax=Fluoribacter gormanii TaxID=464 RepID=A0A377GMH3_9GAMM|nr:response regulator transcription factor [Fluoribacter gormanii]KTD05103.1 two component response regulator PilR [Fluoribacter gormanii]MCW8445597.1 response regulator transcription factor [Fluoribacter gormanii]MCW8470848.1 response regulator transcription factor [Fluoribacter gormanii]SIQ99133.1 Two-component response regulator, FixJ family, consists of REC and HTH domains [Fluoribacter gormanii]STO26029.1 Transcriptional regulatory protein fixJ [Fluoribacter gormanii]
MNKTIYIVDDDENVLRALKWLFDSMSFEVKIYLDATSFLEQYDPKHTGCLITDVRMPDMDGLELLGKLKRQNSLLNVIIITAYGDIPMAVRAIKAGAIDFITKPINEQDLLKLIKKCLEHYPNHVTRAMDQYELLTESELRALDVIWNKN